MFEIRLPKDEYDQVCSVFENNVQVRSTFDKMVFDPSLSAACRSSIKIVDDILDLGPRPM